jgi:hypothetical protein
MNGETPAEEVRRTRRQLVAAALRDALAEAEMQGVPTKVMKADGELAIAARNHARAIGALDPHLQPKGWHEPVEVAS